MKLGLIVCLIIVANILANWLVNALDFELRPSNEAAVHKLIVLFALLYVILLAFPFVPGIEIGLALIVLLGPRIVFLVYLCTVGGLLLSFLVGRIIPLQGLCRLMDELQFRRTGRLLRSIEPMTSEERLALLMSNAPNRVVPFLLRHRYLALAVALNIPGNFLVGGGGGIALVAGFSRLYSPLALLPTIAMAVAPLPVTVLLFGTEVFNP